MNPLVSFPYRAIVLCCLLLLLLCAPNALAKPGDEWKPVDPSELALKAPVVEKDADAEALFWEVHVADEVNGGDIRTVLNHYIRIKIFTDRGRESQSRIDIPFFNGVKVNDIAARTIKPDGSIIELKKTDVFERTIVKINGNKLKAKSFAMPGVEPGAIIEYRWREERGDHLTFYARMQMQRDIPVQLVKYHIKPLSLPGFNYGMRVQMFHARFNPFAKDKEGFYTTEMHNVPAFHEEPRMPPEAQQRIWMLVYYAEDKKLAPEQYWKEYGKSVYEKNKSSMKVSDEVKQAAAQAIGDATAPEQKLERIFDFCRAKIKNIDDGTSGMTSEERAKWKDNKSPADTLKRGMGTGTDIDMLFAAMANASGFDARIANLANRGDIFWDKTFPDSYFIDSYDIAVKVGDSWRFYDPATTYVPFGMLRWQEEGQQALVSDPKEPFFIQTPLSPPEKSLEKRTARLTLQDDGTLEGDVRIEYTGHLAADKKDDNVKDSPSEREQTLRDMVKERLSTAELSDLHIENVSDPIKPFVYAYHIKVPGYAQRTGKRLFLQPAFFQHGMSPLFPTSDRIHPVYFHYPWSEEDDVTINLPPGYALDNPDAPVPFSAGKISQYDIAVMVTKDGHKLIYKRKFFFGGEDNILFPVASYGALKQYFDGINKEDNHTITLKQSATTASNQ